MWDMTLTPTSGQQSWIAPAWFLIFAFAVSVFVLFPAWAIVAPGIPSTFMALLGPVAVATVTAT